ncbi:MAG: peptidylprolyl isomerase [Pseudomonadales bacterium]|nr:peptidylprolyl isomerase [Pseudomonadales bacterium]
MKRNSSVWRRKSAVCLIGFLLWNSNSVGFAQTMVRVSTNLGDFDIELFDSETPGTVQNFLNYIGSNSYADSIVHRSVPGFVIQGGGFAIEEETTTILAIETDPAIANEPGISNVRGTVAMAKLGGDPNSATSQWFVNLADNTFLDSDNGGFTVFGRVLSDDMVVDSISQLTRVSLGGAFTDLPVVNYNGVNVTRENLVFTDIAVIEEVLAPNRFDNSSGNLVLSIDAGSAGIAELVFTIETSEPDVVIRAQVNSVVSLPSADAGFTTFDGQTGQLVIPELDVDGSVAFRNLVFTLTDADQLLFTLESFE